MNTPTSTPRSPRPYIVGLGGSLRANSSTEKAVRLALAAAAQAGADTLLIEGPALELPMYDAGRLQGTPAAQALVAALRRADGVILASPGYHGSISGLVKNAIDYIEELSQDTSPYLHGRAVGCIATGGGWLGGAATLSALRDVVHALRGWPTPLGVVINTAEPVFDTAGTCLQPRVQAQLDTLGQQVVAFALSQRSAQAPAALAA